MDSQEIPAYHILRLFIDKKRIRLQSSLIMQLDLVTKSKPNKTHFKSYYIFPFYAYISMRSHRKETVITRH